MITLDSVVVVVVETAVERDTAAEEALALALALVLALPAMIFISISMKDYQYIKYQDALGWKYTNTREPFLG